MNRMAALAAMMNQQSQNEGPLVSFKAGLMTVEGGMVTADPRRGRLKLVVGSDDQALHLQWTERPSGEMERQNDIILFPKGAVWEKVPECTTGRVYVLRFRKSSRKRFFWMQEVSEDDDEDLAKSINEYIEKPPEANSGIDPQLLAQMGVTPEQAQNMQSMFRAQAAQQRMGGGGGFGQQQRQPPPLGGARTVTRGETAQAISSSAQPSGATATGAAGAPSGAAGTGASGALAAQLMAQYQAQLQAQARTSLTPVLSSARVLPHLDEKMREELMQYLPESQRTPEALDATLRSPQLQQTTDRLTSVLNSSQFGVLMSSLGLSHQGNIGVQAFIDAIQAAADEEKKKEDADKDKDKDKDKDGDDQADPDGDASMSPN